MFEPVSVKILKLLKSNPRKLPRGLIADSIGEELKYVNRALQKLVEKDMVIEEGGHYSYKLTVANEELSAKLFQLYDRVIPILDFLKRLRSDKHGGSGEVKR